jgi:hypothetical protein
MLRRRVAASTGISTAATARCIQARATRWVRMMPCPEEGYGDAEQDVKEAGGPSSKLWTRVNTPVLSILS